MFESRHYEVRQKFRLRNQYNIYEDGEHILSSAQKRFRLKEDFRFNDPDSGDEGFRVKADSVLDITAAYDIVDSRTEERVGSVRRKAKSFAKHEYELLDDDQNVVGLLKEDSVARAVIRRFVTSLVPFSYVLEAPDGEHLGDVEGALALRDKYSVDLASDDIDPRLAVIGTIVVDAIEAN